MRTLIDPIRRLSSELAWLRQEHHAASLASKRTRREQLAAEMAVIRMHDAWARYCRELVILSATGNTATLNGVIVPEVIRRRSDVVPILLATYKKQKYEPRWEKATECIDAASRLKVSNLTTLTAALGAANSPAEEIRLVRNFYAHRKRGAAARALECNGFKGPRPVVFDLASYRNAGETYIDSWSSGLVLVATAASQ